MGGRSSEHEISLASARSVTAALDPSRYETVALEIGRDGRWALPPAELWRELASGASPQSDETSQGNDAGPESDNLSLGASAASTLPVPADGRGPAALLAEVDVVFPVLHGPFGEDGTVQGLLELAGVPYVGAGVLASALCMDKDVFKSVMRDNGIPVTRNVTLRPGDPVASPYPFPVFVKPARLGSSVGISKAHDEAELADAVALAFRHDEKVLVEELVTGIEVECGVLGNAGSPIASLPGEIVAHNEWYDYSAKYDEDGMELHVPARITDEQAARVQELSVSAFTATDCEGMARADCFVREDGEVLVNELNTIPGFTATSVYARLFEASGIGYAELLDRLVELALERHERRRGLAF
jgi:D-alanine-D-alanine ligase